MPTPAPPAVLDRLVDAMAALARSLQAEVCAALERLDGGARFSAEAWERAGGGGGISRALEGGAVLEKACVNVSHVFGALPPALRGAVQGQGGEFAAAGLSVIVHPASPLVPTAHANVRLVRRGEVAWFGGGADLTPHYLFEEDCRLFHGALREACERHEPGSYPRHKRAADSYFFLPHRGEHRGVGGIFYEDLGGDLGAELRFSEAVMRAFLGGYLPIVARRKDLPFGEPERRWQEIRRGRYVEFNLLHDRGTSFGLQSGGRTESVLASLPPRVRWVHREQPAPGSREEVLHEVLRSPRDWA
ncbi:MAG TPA: oxygen-dependent coproporphyrinogen oxidase [Anaeromyxobacter sp.]|nr:oxygen-dependent coproporphyrinogen oxidase [Anaeromyxobacter sp.]